MPEGLLTVLKFCLLALLYLFLFRVVRVITLELRNPAPPVAPVATAPPPPPAHRERKADRKGLALRIVEPAARRGEPFPAGDDLTVGRAGGCAVVLADDTYVSQVHARVFRRDDELWVEDLGSRNGTFVDGKRLEAPARLTKGTRVQFGNTIAEVVR